MLQESLGDGGDTPVGGIAQAPPPLDVAADLVDQRVFGVGLQVKGRLPGGRLFPRGRNGDDEARRTAPLPRLALRAADRSGRADDAIPARDRANSESAVRRSCSPSSPRTTVRTWAAGLSCARQSRILCEDDSVAKGCQRIPHKRAFDCSWCQRMRLLGRRPGADFSMATTAAARCLKSAVFTGGSGSMLGTLPVHPSNAVPDFGFWRDTRPALGLARSATNRTIGLCVRPAMRCRSRWSSSGCLQDAYSGSISRQCKQKRPRGTASTA